MSSKRCRIRFRSGDLISAVDEVTCDDEASVANKTNPGNQSVGVAVFVRLIGITPQNAFAPTGFSLVCTGAHHNVLGSFNEVDIRGLCTLAHLPIHYDRVAAGHDVHTRPQRRWKNHSSQQSRMPVNSLADLGAISYL